MDTNTRPSRRSAVALAAAVVCLLMAPGSISRSQAPAPRFPALPPLAAHRPVVQARAADCGARALELVAARTRRRLAELLPGTAGAPDAVAAAMSADPRAAAAVTDAFARDGVLKTESALGRGCVMTERRAL